MSDEKAVWPTRLFTAGGMQLGIEWSDGQRRSYTAAELRAHCPCATCVAERPRGESQESPPAETGLSVTVAQMTPVGNYAYKITFSDGHDTGIYPLDLLRRLGTERP